jgi:hypothetical protein
MVPCSSRSGAALTRIVARRPSGPLHLHFLAEDFGPGQRPDGREIAHRQRPAGSIARDEALPVRLALGVSLRRFAQQVFGGVVLKAHRPSRFMMTSAAGTALMMASSS